MLNELTPEQETILEETKNKWIGYIFDDRLELDKQQARESVEWLYKLANLKEPDVTYFKSPMAAQLASNILESVDEGTDIPHINAISNTINYLRTGDVNDPRVISNWEHQANRTGESFTQQAKNFVKNLLAKKGNTKIEIGDVDEEIPKRFDSSKLSPQETVGKSLEEQLQLFSTKEINPTMLTQVSDELSIFLSTRFQSNETLISISDMDSMDNNLKESKIEELSHEREQMMVQNIEELKYYPFSIIGNVSDYNWMAFYDFFEQIGIFQNDNYDNYKKLFLSGISDQIQYEGLCMVIELPTTIGRDDQNRLHGMTGPAIAWDDDFKLYFWRGVPVTQKIIETPEMLTRDEIMGESNVEIRRAIHERMGTDMYFSKFDVNEIDRAMDEYDKEVILYQTREIDNTIQDYLFFLKVICTSTDREYILSINPDRANSAMDARASTFSKTLEEYRPDIQT